MYQTILPLQPRIQWEGNYGYCGETSMIMAGLFYGQYISQYDARAIASSDADQTLQSSQLIIGINDETAAAGMLLSGKEYPFGSQTSAASTQDYLVWVKRMILLGYPVIIGVLMNEKRFTLSDPQPDYDHIVPVYGIQSSHPLSVSDSTYYADDNILFYDNGVYNYYHPGAPPQNKFNYSFGEFQKTRKGANGTSVAPYSLVVCDPPNSVMNYAIAIQGIVPESATAPKTPRVQVTAVPTSEDPPITDGSGAKPSPGLLELTVTVFDLEPGIAYDLCRYSNFLDVWKPGKGVKTGIPVGSAGSWSTVENISSSDMAIYRVLRA